MVKCQRKLIILIFFIENVFFKGKWGSEFQYAMLRREWDERNNEGKN